MAKQYVVRMKGEWVIEHKSPKHSLLGKMKVGADTEEEARWMFSERFPDHEILKVRRNEFSDGILCCCVENTIFEPLEEK